MEQPINRLLLITLLLSFPTVAMSARLLLQLPKPVNSSEFARIEPYITVIHNLHPLPWLVIDTPSVHSRLRIQQREQDYAIFPDIKGYFAAQPTLPNDELYDKQWHLNQIGVPTLWETTMGEGAIVAVIDSGVDAQHPDLKGNILFEQGYDFGDNDPYPYDENGHGTAMAGLIVAKCHNGMGGCGVAPAAQVIPYKVNVQDANDFYASNLASALIAAADSPAKIISLSLVFNEHSPVIEEALRYAQSKDKVIVAAVGNTGGTVMFPAYLPWVIGVGAMDKTGQRWRLSNYGRGLSLIAPGVGLYTTLPGTGYTSGYDGTSAAAALTSGIFALMVALQPTSSAPELMANLLNATEDREQAGFDDETGFGYLKVPILSISAIIETLLAFAPATQTLYHPGQTLSLVLYLNNIRNQSGDLYLRLNVPINDWGERTSLFKVWNHEDTVEMTPYNKFLMTPYILNDDFMLPLYGDTDALLGTGTIDSSLQEGAYELSALLIFTNKLSVKIRKIIWITNTGR